MALYLFCAFLATGTINFICSILILRSLAEAGIKVGFFEIRWQVHKHLATYRQTTSAKTGRVAWPYHGYRASLVAMIAFAILTLLSLGF